MNIRQVVKNSPLLAGMYYAYRRGKYMRKMSRYREVKTDPKLILFNSFNGRGYGDNPKAIAEAFHRLFPSLKLVWTCRDETDEESLPDYIRPVRFHSDAYFEILATAKVWVFNVLPPSGVTKRKDQIYVQTWHGDRPLKKILNDASEDSRKYQKTSDRVDSEKKYCDYFVSGSAWFSEVWRRTADYPGEIIEYGMPRNDCLVNHEQPENQQRVMRFRKQYGISENTKVLLYAPTFRDHSLNEEIIDIHPNLNEIIAFLEKRDRCEWTCIVRGHHGKGLSVNGSEQAYTDVTAYPDMSDVLMAADLLITDYSSCAGDYALLHRPVIMYQADYQEYTEKDRKLYFRMEDTPYFIARTTDEICALLQSVSEETVYRNCEDILSLYKVHESGNSAETVCRILADRMAESEKGYGSE